MAHSNGYRSEIEEAIRLTADGLRPWMEQRLGQWPNSRFGDANRNDPSYLIDVLLANWSDKFSDGMGREGMTLIHEYRHTRNKWAHNETFDRIDAIRALDTCRRILGAIESPHQATVDRRLTQLLDMQPVPVEANPPLSVPTPPSRGQSRYRRARDQSFRDELWRERYSPHIEPINRFVDDLIEQRPEQWVPYVAPNHGGTDAELVLLFQDPGRMTAPGEGGSGFLCSENDDPSAELLSQCLEKAGVRASQVLPWNSYPWYLPDNRRVGASMRNEGTAPLRQLLALSPQAHTVITFGTVAHDTWQRFKRAHPQDANRYRHLRTFHTSGRGITNGGRQTKAEGVAQVVNTLRRATTTRTGEHDSSD